MVYLTESRRLGVHCGKCCTSVILVFAFIIFAAGLAFRLYIGLSLQLYYHAAHVAVLTSITALFILSHHLIQTKWLPCCTSLGMKIWQLVLNILYLAACVAIAIPYLLLLLSLPTMNWDYLGATIAGWIGSLCMFYLITILSGVLCCQTWRSKRYDVGYEMQQGRYAHEEMIDLDSSVVTLTSSSLGFGQESKKDSRRYQNKAGYYCMIFLKTFLAIYYLLLQILILICFATTVYNVSSALIDFETTSNNNDTFTIRVEGHDAIALTLNCTTTGNPTVIIEEGPGQLNPLSWEFLPKLLAMKYKVCLHERRGYGWSDTYESDYPSFLYDNAEAALTDSLYFEQLVNQSEIEKPFVYIGRGYGSYLALDYAFRFPNDLKGIILLDAQEASPLAPLKPHLDSIINFLPVGFVRIALDLGWYDLAKELPQLLDYDQISTQALQDSLTQVKSGYFLLSSFREMVVANRFNTTKGIINLVQEKANNDTYITTPVCVFDSDKQNYWFPDMYFRSFTRSKNYQVLKKQSNISLFYNQEYNEEASQHIENCIENF